MQERSRSDADRTTVICIDSYDQGVPEGRFYNLGLEDGGSAFHGLTQLLTGMENIFDAAGFPQQFTAMRSFAPTPQPQLECPADPKHKNGRLATFVVKVLFRQHTSWQGSVTWTEGKMEQAFRSVLELVLLIDSALK